MLKMGLPFNIFFLCLLGLVGASQEFIELLNLYETTEISQADRTIAVSVSARDLNGVSSSILTAESWLRTHLLAHYPATKISTIVLGKSVLCRRDQEEKWGLVLPSLKNVYHSLRRWGLEQEIKVSAAFSSHCFHPNSVSYSGDLAEKIIKPLLEYIRSANSTYSVIPHSNFSQFSAESMSLVSSHLEAMKRLGFSDLNKINFVAAVPREKNPMMRKLSFVDPYPARPTSLPGIAEPPLHSSVGFSVPANIAKKPSPPLAQIESPPPLSFPLAPELPPFMVPASSPFGFTLPPCNPADQIGAPAPGIGLTQKLWCVAKPSVPEDTLQEAMDYACGAGGADCEEVKPHGNCFYPDTVVAHASYAFNNYWQKNKRNGGTCNFGGTAMLINTDPSFVHCQFVLS
ncbi:glucan endo-1,3-beta-glucosidase 1 [Quillaja saponaria]|uniref:glucan endo-1,3-beta-D-glucosidase n=1 Tax=Quillaja saponaria TaxID=32244 RepID=A0AAD7PEK9_QUISA|nr:glucan endo-1,3-beta-glucosidase 1 [Quillaja saponaria]